MNKYRLEYNYIIEIIEADYVAVEYGYACFYIGDAWDGNAELIAIRPICCVTKEGIETETKVKSGVLK